MFGGNLCISIVLIGSVDFRCHFSYTPFPNSMFPHRTTSPTKLTLTQGVSSKSPTYSNENLPVWTTRKIFHNPRPKNKIPVKHPAQGVQRDGRRPFAVYLASQKRKKSPGNTFPRQKKVFYTCFFQKNLKKAQFPSILSPAVS